VSSVASTPDPTLGAGVLTRIRLHTVDGPPAITTTSVQNHPNRRFVVTMQPTVSRLVSPQPHQGTQQKHLSHRREAMNNI